MTMNNPEITTALGSEPISCHIAAQSSPQHPTRRRAPHSTSKQQVKSTDTNQLIKQRARNHHKATIMAPRTLAALLCAALVAVCLAHCAQAADEPVKPDARATQPSVERQLDPPAASAPASSPSSAAAAKPTPAKQPHRSAASSSASSASQKRAAASLASQTNYDKYQLKASPSSHSSSPAIGSLASAASSVAAANSQDSAKAAADKSEKVKSSSSSSDGTNGKPEAGGSSSSSSSNAIQPAHKKAGQPAQKPKSSSFALLKKFLPSFMTSAAAAAAAASASSSLADKQVNPHSRSSAPATSSSALFAHLTGDGPLSYASGKIVNLLAGGAGLASKKKGLIGQEGVSSAIPNHAPFFMRKAAVDRQAGGGAMALASGLLSNPLKLGLLFSAPLLPSLLLTPLAIAGLSPAMSAINNFFGDDDEPAQAQSTSPLAALASGPNSPLASILQATGVSPLPAQASGSQSSGSDSSPSSASTSGNLALQAFQSLLLGPTSTTERPLFNPGMFASSGIGNAMGSLASAATGGSSTSSGGSSGSGGSQSRPLFGGGLIQTAASMISPSFAAPPSSSGGSSSSGSSSSSANDDDGPGIMQMASDVFEKVANYMGTDNKDIGQANSPGSAGGPLSPVAQASSPLSTLASLSSLSPFQLSSLFAPTAFGSAVASTPSSSSSGAAASGSSSAGANTQRASFFSTLRNVYELFSSSFLRRQEVGDSNECQQRLVCELHQRAMNSKLFRRSLQSNLMELANLDKNLIEQLKYGSQAIQARVDPDTKAMLSDFLKATNNFKNGRELVNCGQMFPKCSRTQLLSAANAHLNDPVNGRTIGKFSQLMKKMKFKANQQHQGQWKLRKPSAKVPQMGQAQQQQQQPIAIDYSQVAPMASQLNGAKSSLAPVDSLKLAQQIMMLSQLNQPQAQQQQIQTISNQFAPSSVAPQFGAGRPSAPSQLQYGAQPQASSASYLATPYLSANQYSPAPQQAKQTTTYTDAIVPPQIYATESPYFAPAMGQQQQQPQSYLAPSQMDSLAQYSQPQSAPQQQPANPNQYQSSYQNYAPPSSAMMVDQTQPQQSQQQPIGQQQQQQTMQTMQTMQPGGQDVGKQQALQQTGAKIAVAA